MKILAKPKVWKREVLKEARNIYLPEKVRWMFEALGWMDNAERH